MAQKFGYAAEAQLTREKMADSILYSEDRAHLIRTFTWNSERYFYQDQLLGIQQLGE